MFANLKKERIKNTSFIFYSASFLENLIDGIIGPLFFIYLLSIGFNPAQIGVLLAGERISAFVFEIPTGGFADKYGRKKSILISFSILFLIFILWFFTRNFFILFAASILWGIAHAFQSGAEKTLIIDSLDLTKNDEKRNKVFSHLSIVNNLGFLAGGLAGALLAFYFLNSIWLTASLICIVIFAIYFFFTQDKFFQPAADKKTKNIFRELVSLIKENLSFSFKNKLISIFLIITFIWTLSFSFYNLGYQMFFKKILEVPTYWFGILGSISALVGIAGAWGGEKTSGKFGFIPALCVFSAAISISLFFLGFSRTFILGLTAFVSIEIFSNGWNPIYLSFFNKFIPQEKRATLLSINSSVSTLSLAGGELLAGFLLSFLYPNYVIFISGLLFLITPIFLYKIKKSLRK